MGHTAASFHAATVGMSSTCGGQPYIVPGSADDSYLVWKVEGAPGICGVQMPYGGPYLSPAEIALIRAWIDAGATDN